MRIFFDFNLGRQALICHEMAKYWKECYGIKDYAGMVAVKNGDHLKYLKNQKEIKYHFIDNRDVIEEEALKIKLDPNRIDEIEKKLNIPLWHFVAADRNIGHFFVKGAIFSKTPMMAIANHENIMKWIVYYYDLLDRRLNEFKPDVVVFLIGPASLPPLLLAKICESKKIPYYELATSRVKNLYSIIPNNCKGINKNILEDYQSIINSEKPSERISQFASEYVDSFKRDPKSSEEDGFIRKQSEKLAKQGIFKIFWETVLEFAKMTVGNTVFYFNKKDKGLFLRKKGVLSNVFINMRKKLIARNAVHNFFKDNIDSNDKYVLYTLHLNPEASTMVIAPNFVNQLALIDILAKNIPMTHKLYVKEHFIGVGTRPSQFYKEIKKYPNVKLISPWADTFSLIKNSALVATISGTAGFEAALMEKPAIVFSETFYSKAGLAEYCSDIDKLGDIIKEKIYKGKWTGGKKELDVKTKAMITAIQKNSIEIDATNLIWGRGYKNLAEKKGEINEIAEKFYQAFKK